MKLYEISDQYQNILNNIHNSIDQETGEINETALSLLDEVKTEFREKGIAVASYIKNLEADRKAIEAARKAMAEREQRIRNEIEWLNNYLNSNMQKCGITEISCPYFVVKLKKCPVSVSLDCEMLISDEYVRKVTNISYDKMKIKEKLLAGIEVPGASLKQNTTIVIK